MTYNRISGQASEEIPLLDSTLPDFTLTQTLWEFCLFLD